MNNTYNTIKKIFIPAVVAVILMTACENNNNNFINPKELLAAEQALLDRYYNEIIRNDSTRLEVMSAEAIDTVDHRFESGMMLFHTKIGIGDSIKAYKKVGFRYSNYGIVLQNDTVIKGTDTTFVEVTAEKLRESNEYSVSPFTFTTFPVGSSANSGAYLGVNEAILHMKLYGKTKVVMPSTLADKQFKSHIFEIELTYLEQ